jgi:hypothetical protein
VIAALMPGARAVLRRVTDLWQTPVAPIPKSRTGGRLTSIKAVQRHIGPADAGPLLQGDEQAWRYLIGDALVAGLTRAFALADARPDLLRDAGGVG